MAKAWVLHEIGKISLEDVEIPVPKANEVRIRVMATGVCGSDIPRIYENGAHKMPLIPGHEFSGVVDETGDGVNKALIGKRISVFPKIACGKCDMCLAGMPLQCRDYDYVGSRRDGAFAEYVTAPADNLLEIPENVCFEEAAMLEPFAVAANAVRTGTKGIETDKNVAVCGLGTIGLMTVMLLKEAGINNIYVIGNKPGQKKRSAELGISEDCYCDSSMQDPSKWLSDIKGGISLYYECVGKNETISLGIDTLNPGGRLVLVGNPYSDMAFSRDTWWKLLRNQITVNGIWNSSFSHADPDDDWNYILKRLAESRLQPSKLISHKLDIDELNKGFLIMRDKKEDYCKIIMKNF